MRIAGLVMVLFMVMFAMDGCNSAPAEKDTITGLWNISAGGGDDAHVQEEAYLDLRQDKTYTFYQPVYFDYGHWTYDGNKIMLHSDRKKVLYLKDWELDIVDRDRDMLKVKFPFADQASKIPIPIDDDAKEAIVYTVRKNLFLNRNNVQFDADKDPFSLQHSQWRIRPDHKESCEELEKRVTGLLEHMTLLFDGYAKSDAKDVSWMHSPNPFFLASNGISLQEKSALPKGWVNTFYDIADASRADDLLGKLFNEDIDVPLHYKKYAELWHSLLSQMLAIAKKKDLCTETSAR